MKFNSIIFTSCAGEVTEVCLEIYIKNINTSASTKKEYYIILYYIILYYIILYYIILYYIILYLLYYLHRPEKFTLSRKYVSRGVTIDLNFLVVPNCNLSIFI